MRVDGPQFNSNEGEIPDLVKGPGKYVASYKRSEAFRGIRGHFMPSTLRKLFTGFLEGPMLMAVHTWPASTLGSPSSQSIHHHLLGHLTPNRNASYVLKRRSSSVNLGTLFPTVAQ